MLKARNYMPAVHTYGAKWMPYDLAGMVGQPHVGNIYYVDSVNGSDSDGGKSWEGAFKTLTAAEDVCTTNNYDVIIVAPAGSTSSQELANITWDKNHITVVGAVAPVMIGQRARIEFATDAVDPCFTISGYGNRFLNLKLETAQASNDVMVNMTGDRNYFANVMFQGISNATAGDDATARCLTLTGSHENTYDGCVFGNDTVQRSTTNATVDFAGASKNMFRDCLFMMNADNVGPVHVKSTGATGCSGINEFNNCRFIAKWTNKADQITGAFDLSAQTNSAWMIMSGNTISIGADDWEATAATNIMYFQPHAVSTDTAYWGLASNQTT